MYDHDHNKFVAVGPFSPHFTFYEHLEWHSAKFEVAIAVHLDSFDSTNQPQRRKAFMVHLHFVVTNEGFPDAVADLRIFVLLIEPLDHLLLGTDWMLSRKQVDHDHR
jgi:hypothetical protein